MTEPGTRVVADPDESGPAGGADGTGGADRSRELRAAALAELHAMSPAGDRQARLRNQCVTTAALPAGLARAGRPAHLTASSAILDGSGQHVLLCLHAKIRRWVQPGGHLEPGDASLAAAALREATEETGVVGLVIWPGPLRIDRHPAPCAPPGAAVHDDVQFLLTVPDRRAPRADAESLDVRWFAVDALPPDSDAPLRRLVRAARDRLAAG